MLNREQLLELRGYFNNAYQNPFRIDLVDFTRNTALVLRELLDEKLKEEN